MSFQSSVCPLSMVLGPRRPSVTATPTVPWAMTSWAVSPPRYYTVAGDWSRPGRPGTAATNRHSGPWSMSTRSREQHRQEQGVLT